MKNLIWMLGVILFAFSCSTSSKDINYGEDGCHFCRMTIVDKQHASQYVTKKGKHYNFDAIECMINQLTEVDNNEIGTKYATTFLDPGQLKSVDQLTFVISPNIPSPMGAFLTAFDTHEEAEEIIAKNGGEIYSWQEVKKAIKKK